MSKKKSFSHIIRSLHRDLGYFVIGITLIYTITGIVLSGRALGWLEQTYVIEKNLSKDITKIEFIKKLELSFKELDSKSDIPMSIMKSANKSIKYFKFSEEKDNILYFKSRSNNINYNTKSGNVIYKYISYPPYLKSVISAHKATHEKLWFYLAILYSIILSFLAISAMFMVKGKFGFKKRGIYFMLAGIFLVLIFLFIS
ncbi:MAG: hypothetical protein HRT40_05650 [Campylobacteraceae bacterium]|nr:hypothetical protein [Campylobacteraceae bacterium]